MAVEERDPHSGYLTTGHEWNGITELNTPVPRAVYFFLILTALFAVVLLGTHAGLAARVDLYEGAAWKRPARRCRRIAGAGGARSRGMGGAHRERWLCRDSEQSGRDGDRPPTGRTLFGDNCAACHGREARGGNGFPSLIATSWLWGGAPDAIAETIRVGINSAHPDSRTSQMLGFRS